MTHAFFKALLFLGAGAVIIGMHHDQDIRNMGGLRKYMPITWITALLGSLALIGTPFFSGFYSKDSIIEAVHATHIWGSGFANFAVLAGVFVTAFYSFRMYFLVFHGKERFGLAHHHDDHDAHGDHHHGLAPGEKPHEAPWVVTLPLVLLAIPSVLIGYYAIGPMLHGDFFKGVIYVSDKHPAMAEITEAFHGAKAMGMHAFTSLPFILALLGVVSAWYCTLINPRVPAWFHARSWAGVSGCGAVTSMTTRCWNTGSRQVSRDPAMVDATPISPMRAAPGLDRSTAMSPATRSVTPWTFVVVPARCSSTRYETDEVSVMR
jgi:NADH-quinone oxidoreductase subunit L